MASLRVLCGRGDIGVAWSPEKVELGDPDALAAVAEAERIFVEEREKGSLAFVDERGQPGVIIEEFGPTVEQRIVIVPQMVGG